MRDKIATAIAWYRAEDWATLKARAVDAGKMHATHAECLAGAINAERDVRKQGVKTMRITLDLDALTLWCSIRGRVNDGAARSEYAAELADKRLDAASRRGR